MHQMNDASMGKKQAAAVVWTSSCLAGPLQTVPNPLSLHWGGGGGLAMLEHT